MMERPRKSALSGFFDFCKRVGLLAGGAMSLIAGFAWAQDGPGKPTNGWSEEREIYVPMRDGVRLSTDVLRPSSATGKVPAILIRSPYEGKEWTIFKDFLKTYLQQGYAVVLQNERGKYFSEGVFNDYLQGATTDGSDTLDWIVKQPWSNGRVGSFGCSSSGETQWLMAAANNPAQAAMIPAGTWAVGKIPGNDTRGAFYRGGVPLIGFWATWYENLAPTERLLIPPNSTQEQRIRLRASYNLSPKTVFSTVDHPEVPQQVGYVYHPNKDILHLPSKDILRAVGGALTPFDKYITWTPADPRWDHVELFTDGMRPRVPALHMSTWYDPGVMETIRLFKYLQDLGTPNQYLLIGAGSHCSMFVDEILADTKTSELIDDYHQDVLSGMKSMGYLDFNLADTDLGEVKLGDTRYGGVDHGYANLFLKWFDHWLKGEPNNVADMPKVQLHVAHKGWLFANEWPIPGTRVMKYYLRADTGIHTGVLSTVQQAADAPYSYLYDPGAPTPSLGGGCCWTAVAVDQQPTESRSDVLVYSTPVLTSPTTVVGPVEVVLYVSSSAPDTDFMVKLIDVYPDGKAINLSEDAFRARYRNGFDKPETMQAGKVYKITLPNMVTATQFQKGHRIRLDISSSNFPAYERNLNTGGNNYDEVTWIVAKNSIHHGSRYPSYIALPVLPE